MPRLKTPQEERNFEAYIEALFRLDDYATVHDKLGELNVPAPYRLRIKVLYSKTSIKNVIDGLVK